MPMFGSTTTVRVQVEPAEVLAGQEVTCRVELGEIDAKVRRARVEIGYYNAYPDAVNTDESQMHRVEDFSDWVAVGSVPLFGDPPSPGRQDVRVQVPEDAPSTVPGEVDWRIRAVVDRRRGRDAYAEAPLIVRGDWARLAYLAQTPAESSIGEIPVSIDVASRQLRPGETVTGTVTVTPSEDFHIRGVRVQLASERGSEYVKQTTRVGSQSVVGERTLQPGQPSTAPFTFVIPADATPTYEARESSHHWYIEAVPDVAVLPDDITRLEILVTPALTATETADDST